MVGHAHRIAIAEVKARKWRLGCDLDERDIDLIGYRKQCRAQQRVVLQRDEDVRGALDYVAVGGDDAARIDDEAGAQEAAAA